MPETLICFRVALIGPSDTEPLVPVFRAVVDELTEEFRERSVMLSHHHWADLPPGLGKPQEYIDTTIDWTRMDFVVGLMGLRLGASLEGKRSGTEHECQLVIDLYTKRKQPDLLFFFKNLNNQVLDPIIQERIEIFRADLQAKGLTATYDTDTDFRSKLKYSLRSKIEAKLKLQHSVQRRVGELPPNHNISVEMIISSELRDDWIVPTIVIFKNTREEHFVFDSRYMNSQDLIDWVAQSMGLSPSTGAPLQEVLAIANRDNIENNTGVIQLWLGGILMTDHPAANIGKWQIALVKVFKKDGRIDFGFVEGLNEISHPGWKIMRNRNGQLDINL